MLGGAASAEVDAGGISPDLRVGASSWVGKGEDQSVSRLYVCHLFQKFVLENCSNWLTGSFARFFSPSQILAKS